MRSPGALRVAAVAATALLLLCVCRAAPPEAPATLSDVQKELRILRGMVMDLRGGNRVMNQKLSDSQKQVAALQKRMGPGEEPCCCNHTLIQSLQNRLGSSEDQVQMIQTRLNSSDDQVKNLQRKDSEWRREKEQLVKQLDQLQSRHNNLSRHWDDLEARNILQPAPPEPKATESPGDRNIRPPEPKTTRRPGPDELQRRLCGSGVESAFRSQSQSVDRSASHRQIRILPVGGWNTTDLTVLVAWTAWRWTTSQDCVYYYYDGGYSTGSYNSVCSFTTRWMCEKVEL